MAEIFRAIDGKPIRWRDRTDMVHACEGVVMPDGRRRFWTLCGLDVPPDAVFVPVRPRDEISCAICQRHLRDGTSPPFDPAKPKGGGQIEGVMPASHTRAHDDGVA